MISALLSKKDSVPLQMGATCPNCGSTNTHRLKIEKNGKVVQTLFECNDCGNVW